MLTPKAYKSFETWTEIKVSKVTQNESRQQGRCLATNYNVSVRHDNIVGYKWNWPFESSEQPPRCTCPSVRWPCAWDLVTDPQTDRWKQRPQMVIQVPALPGFWETESEWCQWWMHFKHWLIHVWQFMAAMFCICFSAWHERQKNCVQELLR